MNAAGQTQEFPHFTRETSRSKARSHLTDVSARNWRREDIGAPRGNYPTKTFFPVSTPEGPIPPKLSTGQQATLTSKHGRYNNQQDTKNAKLNKVFVPDPNGYFIDHADKSKRHELTAAQETQTLRDVNDRWEGRELITRRRPTR
jgi:hypothetical protein